jgi:alkylation response protein AidB-like acyl-CoA dehydrogenase
MNFDLGETEKTLCEELKGLFSVDTRAALVRLEKGESEDIRGLTLKILKALGQINYLNLGLENGRNSVTLALAQETLASISPSLYLSVETSTRLFGRLLSLYGTSDQKARILPRLEKGELIGTVALTEENMGIDNNPLNTTAIRDDGGFLVSGTKGHVVNAPLADWFAVAGRVGGQEKDGIAFFLIQRENKGLSLGERRPTLGYKGATVSSLTLENSPVLARHVIGPSRTRGVLREIRSWEDQVLTAAGLGLMKRAFDAASRHAKSHSSGGKPIIAYQEIGFKLAEMLALLQTAQLLAYRAAWMDESGDGEAGILTHCAKVLCSESAEAVTSSALQILGGKGYIQGNPAEEGYRDAKYLQIAGTSSEISRMKIADGILY